MIAASPKRSFRRLVLPADLGGEPPVRAGAPVGREPEVRFVGEIGREQNGRFLNEWAPNRTLPFHGRPANLEPLRSFLAGRDATS